MERKSHQICLACIFIKSHHNFATFLAEKHIDIVLSFDYNVSQFIMNAKAHLIGNYAIHLLYTLPASCCCYYCSCFCFILIKTYIHFILTRCFDSISCLQLVIERSLKALIAQTIYMYRRRHRHRHSIP